MPRSLALLTFVLVLSALALAPAPAIAPAQPALIVLGRDGRRLSALTDGDRVRLQVHLAEGVPSPTVVTFYLAPGGLRVAACTVPAGRAGCRTSLLASLGWHWDPGGLARPLRVLEARISGRTVAASPVLQVNPRPVVFVHGFNSDASTWAKYLGPGGYLAGVGVPAYAVGDGQVPGALNTGHLTEPAVRTNTIAENAAILGEYIAGVKRQTGAQQVDLVAHSMGGLISRYYIDRVMDGRDIGQFLTLGTPNAGTDCADLGAALGVLHPATLEIRPSYVNGIFNRQITHLHGVPYRSVAGTPIQDAVGAPCTSTPTDLFVSLDSASALPVSVGQIAVLHHELNTSPDVFEQVVKPFVQATAAQLQAVPDPVLPSATAAPLQFTRVITGHVALGASQTYTVPLESGLSVASFALYDVTRSLSVTVRGASGNLIDLSPQANGLIVVDDPATLLYLGYGFANPRPGPWQVTLSATSSTPGGGADFALTAHLQGGATLEAQADPLLPAQNQAVALTGRLTLAGQPLPVQQAQAVIRGPGGTETVALSADGGQVRASWRPRSAGVYGIDLTVTATAPDGSAVERTAFLAVEAQPRPNLLPTYLILAALGLFLLFLLTVVVWSALALGRRLARR